MDKALPFYCRRRTGSVIGAGNTKRCGKPATVNRYGMPRCRDHSADLNPRTWPQTWGRHCDE